MPFGRLSCAIVLVLVSGCGQDCTVVGCDSGILVDSAAVFATESLPLSVTVCADEVCQTRRIDSSSVEPGQGFVAVYARVNLDDEEREREVAVTLEVRSESTGEMLADVSGTGDLKRTQPNGASCGPTCYFAHLTYDDPSKALVA